MSGGYCWLMKTRRTVTEEKKITSGDEPDGPVEGLASEPEIFLHIDLE